MGDDWKDIISGAMWGVNTSVGAISTYTVYSGGYYKWNEVWHKYKTTTAGGGKKVGGIIS